MDEMTDLNVMLFEQSGAVGKVSANKLASLLMLYAEKHPELLEAENEKQEETP